MTRQRWIILAMLGLAVILLYCIGGIALLNYLTQPITVTSMPFEIPTDLVSPTPRVSATARTTSTATPTSTPQATATWVIPPVTPIAETPAALTTDTPSTPQPTTPGNVARGPIIEAWNKAKNAATYRIEYDWTIKGNFPDIPAEWNAGQGLQLFSVAGAVNGKDSQMTFKGFWSVLFTGDPNASMEIMSIGGKAYIKGPAPLIGAAENKWYVSSGASTNSLPKVNEYADVLSDPNVDLSAFRRTSTDTFDNRRCEVYTGDKVATFKLFQLLDAKDTPDKDTLKEVETAETKFWVCDDSYLHQFTMNIEGRNKDKPNEKVEFQLRLHLFDLNGNVKITPPQNASPLSFFNLATPTKTK